MAESNFDLIVIGSGPGGYVAAIRAAQLGMKVACVERGCLGGTCLNVGCIPSKALLDSSHHLYDIQHHMARRGIRTGDVSVDLPTMMKFKDDVVKKMVGGVGYLFKKNKIEHLNGQGKIVAAGTVEVKGASGTNLYKTKNILIATGSAPIQIPVLPFDGKNILSSTEALTLTEIPKKMIVVGGGYIGVEMGSVWSRLGSEVLVLEFMPGILPPSDREMALALQRLLEKQGIKFRFNTVADLAKVQGNKIKVNFKSGEETGSEEVDKVLICVGRRPVTDGLGLAEAGVAMDKKGFVIVDGHFATRRGGDFRDRRCDRRHHACPQGRGGRRRRHRGDDRAIVARELSRVPERGLHASGTCAGWVDRGRSRQCGPIKVGKFPFTANGRAWGMAETDGFVKVIGDAATDRLLGVHILGAHASDMIAEAVIAMEFASSVEDVARSFHAHPTMPEAIREAALAAEKRVRQM